MLSTPKDRSRDRCRPDKAKTVNGDAAGWHSAMRLVGSRECGTLAGADPSRAAAILIVGPRAVGKTTTALRFAREVVRLDREA
jgi:DNA polymerase III delta prime subunit